MDADPIPHDVLMRHAGFLRGLARDLVRDPSAAEDAVQDVWLLALEHPPKHASNLRGWLRVLLTNLVRSKARSSTRREIRERERAIDQREAALAPVVQDETMLRPVTEAVLSLPDPLRSTVLKHYFEGLTTSAIAASESVPLSTVKSRLQRALEILRMRLQREHGDTWALGLLPFVSSNAHHLAAGAGMGKGTLLMSLKTKVAILSAVLLVVGFFYRELSSSSAAPSTSLAPTEPLAIAAENRGTTQSEPPLAAKPPTPGRETINAQQATSNSNQRSKSLFYGSLLGPDGEPLRGLWSEGVVLTDGDGMRRNCDAKAEGAFAFSVLPAGRYWVAAYADGYQASNDVMDIDSDHSQIQRDFTLSPKPILKIRVTTPDGKNLFEVLTGPDAPKFHPVLVPVATKERPGKWFDDVVGSLNNPFGIGQYWSYGPRVEALPPGCMGILMIDGALPAFVSLVNYHRVLQTQEAAPGQDEVLFVLSLDELQASCAEIRLQVVDAVTQAPLVGASVELSGGPSSGRGSQTDADGRAEITGCEPGEFDLRVSAKDHEQYSRRFLADSGTVTDLGRIALEKGMSVEVEVVDGEGTPHGERFSLGTIDSVTDKLVVDRGRIYESSTGGQLKFDRLGRHVYVIQSANHDAINDSAAGPSANKLVSGNVVLDLRSGAAPAKLRITLAPAVRMMLSVTGQPADGLRFRVTDEQGLDIASSRFYGSAPRPLTLPSGKYRVALIGAGGAVLGEKSVTLGSSSSNVVFVR